MILLDLFSGYGGFHKGLEQAGFNFRKVYFSEIDKHAVANYKYNYNEAEHIGAVEHILNAGIERPNIITFGSPCQDFSLAGKRRGLDGERSSLIEYALSAISHFQPDVFIWENVKGAYSSNNSEDFWAIIQAFANIGGYGLEWQLVNTSWLLPQNRERIFLVGHIATAFPNWRGVFPIGENDEVFNATGKTNKKQLQAEICSTIKQGFGNKGDDTFVLCRDVARCLTGGGHSGGLHSDMNTVKILQRGHGFVNTSELDICPTIRCNSFEHNTAVLSYTRDAKGKVQNYHSKDICNTLHSATGSGGNTDQYIQDGFRLRRLTEIECERLQGLPDNWTKFGKYNGETKEISQTQRYKLCGNGVTVKMVEIIAKKILKNYKLK